MNKILLSFVLGIMLFGLLPSVASAANATNWSGTPYVWGNPVTNPDGSISAAMPNGWGSYGADPFDVWTGVYGPFDGALAGKTWYINNRWLDDWGGRKTAELLGLNVPIYNNPGSCPFVEIAAGTKTNIICGSNSGKTTPPGSWRHYRIGADGKNTSVVLEAYADYFLMGMDNVAKYLFENAFDPKVECYGRSSPYIRVNSDGTFTTFEQMKSNIEGVNLSSCQPRSGGSTTPTTPGTTLTPTTGSTPTTIDPATETMLAETKALVDSVRARYEQILQQLGVSSSSQLVNTSVLFPTNTQTTGTLSVTAGNTLPAVQPSTTVTTLSPTQVAQVQNQILVLLLQVVELQTKLAAMQ